MIEKITKLIVKYNEKIVGYLVDLSDGRIAFQYDEEWQKTGFSISPLSLKLTNEVYINKKDYFKGLYGVFNDSLPDGWGELLTRRMLATQGLNPDNVSPLVRLSILNKSSLGALTYEPAQIEGEANVNLDLDQLAEESEKILDSESEGVDLDQVYALAGSSGGARPKAHLDINGTYWIIKFPSHYDPKEIGKIEYNSNDLARKCGINVNEFKLFPSKKCEGYFGAMRFDRKDGKRIHMISLSSILETTHRIPNLDYMHLFQVIEKICVDKSDMYEAFRRMCFNVLYGNKDDHGKNFAFLYDEDLKGYRLSPAYDITKTLDKSEHEMTVNGKGKPSETDLMEICRIFNLSEKKCREIIENINNVLKKISTK